MNLITWSPFRDLDQLFARYATSDGSPAAGIEWRPSADIVENEKEYLIKADLPAVKKADLQIHVDNNVLTLSGERHVEKSSEGEKEHRRETYYGQFSRSFALPDDVDQTKISAESKDGVLSIHLPKSADRQPRSISVTVN